MDAVVPLFGVVIGGLLVLITDFIRRRIEWRRELVKTLAASGSDLIVILHRTVGELAEARGDGPASREPEHWPRGATSGVAASTPTPGGRALRAAVARVHGAACSAQEAAQDVSDDAAREYWKATESLELALTELWFAVVHREILECRCQVRR